ncbi:uncharacterized protein LOC127720049 [Mytilus californianus]|uniref:uncharacterized protein LOC127720049 n=1 Tax=Mytilus californianus TaxID=6549 RepID=UPI0022450401|nr:uncharacterized protein LOC127720049 [Mytilus californianus]
MMIGKTYIIVLIIGLIAFSNGATTISSTTVSPDAMEPSTMEQSSESDAATTVMSADAVTTTSSDDATTNPQPAATTVMAETTQQAMTVPMMDPTTGIMMDPTTEKMMDLTTEKMMDPTTEKMMDPTTGPMIPVTKIMERTTTPPCSGANCNGQSQESEFGRVGLVAFGIMFAISVILLVLLIIVVYRFKSQSGTYKTNEASSPRHMMDGIHMTMPMDNGGLDNVHTIDLDKGEGEERGAGVSTFAAVNEHESKNGNGVKSSFGATDKSEFKSADSGSINNLLHTEESDKNDDSDKESDTENPDTLIGLKVEPSTGASVESLERLKETDNLMDDEDKDDASGSESEDDEDLPPPALSDSDNDDKNKGDQSEV